MRHDQGRLTTLEPRVDLAVLLLTIMTSSRGLSVTRRGTTTDSLLLVEGAGVVGEVAENRGVSGLERQAGEVGRQGGDRGICRCPTAQRSAGREESGRHGRGAEAAVVTR